MSASYGTGPASGEYSVEKENQLQPEDTLVERGIDDALDEGYSPPERAHGRGAFGTAESMDQLLAEEEPDPASHINVPLDKDEQQRSDEAEREDEFPRRGEVGRLRAGRLVAPDRDLAETQKQSWWLTTSASAEEQPLPRRPRFTSSTTSSSGRRMRTRRSCLWVTQQRAFGAFGGSEPGLTLRRKRGWRPRADSFPLSARDQRLSDRRHDGLTPVADGDESGCILTSNPTG